MQGPQQLATARIETSTEGLQMPRQPILARIDLTLLERVLSQEVLRDSNISMKVTTMKECPNTALTEMGATAVGSP